MSMLLLAVVIVGAVFAGNLTPVNVLVKPPLPVFNSKINDLPAVLDGIVHVQLAVNVAVMMVELAMLIVCVVLELPIAVTLSVYALIVGLARVGVFPKTTLPVPVDVLKSVKPASHEFSSIPDARIHVHIAVVPDTTVITALAPDD